MKNKSGFISMALVYTFLIIFIFVMTAIIECYSQKNMFLEAINNKVNNDLGMNNHGKKSLFDTILSDNIAVSSYDINYNKISSKTNGRGLYYADDINITDENNNCDITNGYDCDPKRIYFYRGDVKNNFVVFGNMFERLNPPHDGQSNGKSTKIYIDPTTNYYICWQIVRTNEDESIRLAMYGFYDGDNNKCEPFSQEMLSSLYSPYSDVADGNAYVGYTYGNTNSYDEYSTLNGINNSTVKYFLDEWISKNTNFYNTYGLAKEITYDENDEEISRTSYDNLNKYLANGIFCNDKGINYDEDSIFGEINTKLGYGKNITFYASSRFIDDGSNNITYKCSNDDYMYSAENVNNNIDLDYNVGLLTINDVIFAGGKVGVDNKDYFLHSNYSYWTMSPVGFYDEANVFIVDENGNLAPKAVNTFEGVVARPVINVIKDISVNSGTGYINDPYLLVNVE